MTKEQAQAIIDTVMDEIRKVYAQSSLEDEFMQINSPEKVEQMVKMKTMFVQQAKKPAIQAMGTIPGSAEMIAKLVDEKKNLIKDIAQTRLQQLQKTDPKHSVEKQEGLSTTDANRIIKTWIGNVQEGFEKKFLNESFERADTSLKVENYKTHLLRSLKKSQKDPKLREALKVVPEGTSIIEAVVVGSRKVIETTAQKRLAEIEKAKIQSPDKSSPVAAKHEKNASATRLPEVIISKDLADGINTLMATVTAASFVDFKAAKTLDDIKKHRTTLEGMLNQLEDLSKKLPPEASHSAKEVQELVKAKKIAVINAAQQQIKDNAKTRGVVTDKEAVSAILQQITTLAKQIEAKEFLIFKASTFDELLTQKEGRRTQIKALHSLLDKIEGQHPDVAKYRVLADSKASAINPAAEIVETMLSIESIAERLKDSYIDFDGLVDPEAILNHRQQLLLPVRNLKNAITKIANHKEQPRLKGLMQVAEGMEKEIVKASQAQYHKIDAISSQIGAIIANNLAAFDSIHIEKAYSTDDVLQRQKNMLSNLQVFRTNPELIKVGAPVGFDGKNREHPLVLKFVEETKKAIHDATQAHIEKLKSSQPLIASLVKRLTDSLNINTFARANSESGINDVQNQLISIMDKETKNHSLGSNFLNSHPAIVALKARITQAAQGRRQDLGIQAPMDKPMMAPLNDLCADCEDTLGEITQHINSIGLKSGDRECHRTILTFSGQLVNGLSTIQQNPATASKVVPQAIKEVTAIQAKVTDNTLSTLLGRLKNGLSSILDCIKKHTPNPSSFFSLSPQAESPVRHQHAPHAPKK